MGSPRTFQLLLASSLAVRGPALALGLGLGASACCSGVDATDATYRKNLAAFDAELARAPLSLQPEMKVLRAGFEKRRAAAAAPSPELNSVARDVLTSRAVYSQKVTQSLGALALPELKRRDWIGVFRSRKGRVEEKVEVTPEGRLIASLYLRRGAKDTTRPHGGTIVGLRSDAIVYRPVGLDASDEVFAFESPPRRGPEGHSFSRDGRVYLAR
jgi:hypothetical protein